MNSFDQQLRIAKKKHRMLYVSVFSLVLIGVLIVLTVIFASRGTRIVIKPDDAATQSSIRINGSISVIIGETLYSISKNPTITISANGFQSKSQTLNSKDFGNIITVTLMPLPAKVKLTTNIADDKTNWIINGEIVAISTILEHEVAAGDYEFTVTHPHYKDESLIISLARGEVFNKYINVDPIDGMISIKTKPSGANVQINDIDMGLTPLSLSMQGGFHDLTVTLKNYETINDTIEISNTRPGVNRDYILELKKAEVSVTLKPGNGELILDGIIVTKTNKLTVESGAMHRLTYSKQGYFPESKTFSMSADDALHLIFELKKEMGWVEIESSPMAEVSLNDKPAGTTPLHLSLNAVEQKITLSKQGYRSVTRTIIPSSENQKIISVSLIPEGVARLKEAPNQYTNKAGGTLKLFTPNEIITMGAKRSELGQRANELIKKVKLTKAFYAGVYEVTNSEYNQFDKNRQGDPKKPVTSVSWMDAVAFCNWLSQLEGLTPVYHISNNQLQRINANVDGYRLLSEAEWEWLARKSNKSEQTTFVWGNEHVIPKNAVNIADESAKGKVKVFVSKYNDGYPDVAPVGSLAQEKSGLYDQGGNVSEWTHDSYSIAHKNAGNVIQDPLDLTVSSTHVVKGANWRSGSVTELRPAFREGLNGPRDDLGLRIGRYVYGGN